MKASIVIVAGIAALFFLSTATRALSDPSISALQKQVVDAQKQVDQAQADFDQAKKKAESGTPSDQERVDDARNNLVKAQARLDQARTRLKVAKQKNENDDSSQAIQPENRTQNGSNFSIRSQRDSENHPPLPASQ